MHYLLVRKCSPYTFKDIFIGIYDCEENALDSKNIYIEKVKDSDPYALQCYHEVNLDEDLEITEIEIDSNVLENDNVYILIECAEGFGQSQNNPVYFSTNLDKIKTKAKKINAEKEENAWPCWYEYESVKLNDLRYHNINDRTNFIEID